MEGYTVFGVQNQSALGCFERYKPEYYLKDEVVGVVSVVEKFLKSLEPKNLFLIILID